MFVTSGSWDLFLNVSHLKNSGVGPDDLTAPDRCYYLNQAYLPMFIAGLKRGKTNRSQTATDMEMLIT